MAVRFPFPATIWCLSLSPISVILWKRRRIAMEPKDMIAALRQKHGFSQQNLADQVFVTRQAVSR